MEIAKGKTERRKEKEAKEKKKEQKIGKDSDPGNPGSLRNKGKGEGKETGVLGVE